MVVYDADTGAFAARAWWMLRWLGHPAGGGARRRAGGVDPGRVAGVGRGRAWAPATFTPRVDATARVAVGEVLPHVEQPGHVLVDARAADRFRGQNETLDPVAGHIPGAVNRFFQANLTAEKTFKTPDGAARRVDGGVRRGHAVATW